MERDTCGGHALVAVVAIAGAAVVGAFIYGFHELREHLMRAWRQRDFNSDWF